MHIHHTLHGRYNNQMHLHPYPLHAKENPPQRRKTKKRIPISDPIPVIHSQIVSIHSQSFCLISSVRYHESSLPPTIQVVIILVGIIAVVWTLAFGQIVVLPPVGAVAMILVASVVTCVHVDSGTAASFHFASASLFLVRISCSRYWLNILGRAQSMNFSTAL